MTMAHDLTRSPLCAWDKPIMFGHPSPKKNGLWTLGKQKMQQLLTFWGGTPLIMTILWPFNPSEIGKNPTLRPRGRRKLAWQGALHETHIFFLRMRVLPNVLPVATCRRCPNFGGCVQPTYFWCYWGWWTVEGSSHYIPVYPDYGWLYPLISW